MLAVVLVNYGSDSIQGFMERVAGHAGKARHHPEWANVSALADLSLHTYSCLLPSLSFPFDSRALPSL